MTNAVLIHNPVSRSTLRDDVLASVVRWAEEAGWRVTCINTDYPGHATVIARDAAVRGTDVLIVNGGDGTINEAINGIAHTETALAVLPGGTANVWAKELHTSDDPLTAMRAVVGGERRRIDLGRAGERYFLLMAGLGLDGEVVRRVRPGLKQRFGALSYVVVAMPAAIRTKPRRVQMSIDGVPNETDVYWMIVGNTRLYGGFRDITNRARVDDGKLDVASMRRGGVFHLLVDGVRLLRGRHARSPNICYVQARHVDIETAFIPVQVDGEPHGETPMRFEVAPGALTAIVPAGLRTPLFATPSEASRVAP